MRIDKREYEVSATTDENFPFKVKITIEESWTKPDLLARIQITETEFTQLNLKRIKAKRDLANNNNLDAIEEEMEWRKKKLSKLHEFMPKPKPEPKDPQPNE